MQRQPARAGRCVPPLGRDRKPHGVFCGEGLLLGSLARLLGCIDTKVITGSATHGEQSHHDGSDDERLLGTFGAGRDRLCRHIDLLRPGRCCDINGRRVRPSRLRLIIWHDGCAAYSTELGSVLDFRPAFSAEHSSSPRSRPFKTGMLERPRAWRSAISSKHMLGANCQTLLRNIAG